ncbi:regulator of chromosome condensation (RCC1)-like protein [Phytophthora infestans T30-4]|uniref:Regulator of chromosome condensation (RCC1)-like protein n=2 Tax=Phytophthora infestans TaxID=4787 RepID=D0N6R7_PHYIT|nr:regulator of chromosome condensation (RCC1)-like protein [Phytophthora infestans T30-4]EEY53266.1 regulator of chromosome condensation (RCC1)-like protein [Phytophthora infestans T30-4]KAF4034423.1 Regulator of chromosome condensation (RCC1) repeat [Phytophthora infestans]|eukprot:XP_002904884.1 regulator of chromosome condensation (RCC1)-like protein [Phytophthora infestans T30-4]
MKRGRVDVGVSKEQYEASLAAPADSHDEVGPFPRAPTQVLQARKIVLATPTSCSQEAARQLAALNRAFLANLKAQWVHNKTDSWTQNMKEYISYAREINAKFGAHAGQMLTFGSGDCGQLGHGVEKDKDLMVEFPLVVRPLVKLEIVRVACGGLHSAAITSAGEVFTWGCDDDGALGRVGDENIPTKVTGFGPQQATAVQVVGGDCHTAVVTLAGKVYTWGCYRDKEGKQWCDAPSAKDAFKKKQTEPFLIKALDNIADVRCGSSFNLARTNDGRVYSWGLGEMGQLGRTVDDQMKDFKGDYKVDMVYNDHLQPKPVTLGNDPLPVVKAIGCGSYHSLFALSSNGYLYTCGLNNYGQLGIGNTENCTELQLVEDLSSKNVAYVDGGSHHSVVLTIDGDVYTFGRADSGQLGMLETCSTGDFKDRPQKVTIPKPKDGGSRQVCMISSGSNHTLALTESNAIFSWGYGDMLALGNGVDRDENKPYQVDWSKATNGKDKKGKKMVFGKAEFLQVEAGGQHSAVLARSTDE